MFKRLTRSVSLAILLIMVTSSLAFAVTWGWRYPTIVSDTGGTARTYYPVYLGYGAQNLIDTGKITGSGLNTNMQIGTTSAKFMLSTAKVMAVVPSLLGYSSQTLDLYTGYVPPISHFSVIVGEDGYITTSDHADLELGASFDITFEGYFDTSVGLIGENILYKQDSFRVYVQAAGNIRAAILSGGDAEDYTVDGAVASGVHILRVYTSGSTLSLGLDGVRIAHTHLTQSVTAGDTLTTLAGPLYIGDTGGGAGQRLHHSFYANGRHWIFWGKSNYVQYQSSADGDTWTAPATAVTGLDWDYSYSDFATDGTYVYMAYRASDIGLFRKGTLNTDGSITWLAAASVISAITTGRSPTLALDSNGDLYCAIHSDADDFVYLDKLVTGSTTWVSATGFPKKSGLGPDGHIAGGQIYTWITPMSSGRMYVASAENGTTNKKHGQVFNGATFEAYDHLDSFFQRRFVSYGDTVYLIGGSGNDTTVAIRTYGIGWGAFTNIGTPAGGSGADDAASIGVDDSTGDVYVTRAVASSDIVYYKKYDADTETWDANWTALSDESVDKWLGGVEFYSYSGVGTRMGCAYLTETLDAGDPIVKCAFINLNANPVPDTANDYVMMEGNTVTYTDEIDFTINGTQVLLYQPITYLNGTTLPDRAGTAQNGVITWGANTDIGIAYGEPESSSTTPSGFIPGSGEGTPFDPGDTSMPVTWFGDCSNVSNLPFYDGFYEVSVQTGQSVCDIYFLVMIGMAFGVFLLLAMSTRSALLGVIGFNIVLFAASSTSIVPMWIPFSILIVQIGIMYLYKQVAY